MNEQLNESPLTRRSAIAAAMGAFGLAALGPVERAVAAVRPRSAMPMGENFLVVVELNGGNDGLNMVVPHSLPSYATQRPTLGLSSSDTLAIDTGSFATSDFRLHPRLPALAQMYRDGELAVVQKVGYPDRNGSHDVSRQIWAYGQRERLLSGNGWIARYADLHAPTSTGAVSLARGRHRTMVGGDSNPLTMGRLDQFKFDVDGSFRGDHARRLELVRRFLDRRNGSASRDAMLAGHTVADQISDAVANYSSTVTYRNGRLSESLQDVARMLQAGFPTRVFYTGFGGFDTHAAQGTLVGRHADLMQTLNEGLDDFVQDVKAMGLWSQTVIAVVSEFGRRNFENGSGGTDHGAANHVLLLGGGVRGGFHGPMLVDADLSENNLPYAVDFRTVYSDVLTQHLGVSDPTTIFPEALEVQANLNLFL
ncbi:MAG: DUF1501 domain-containing protein [Planctomycetota bacterium]